MSGSLAGNSARGRLRLILAVLLFLELAPAAALGQEAERPPALPAGASPAEALVSAVEDRALADLLREILRTNPDLAEMQARLDGLARRQDRARALPDPVAGLTTFALPPQTRVGPTRATATFSQRLPWFGKRELQEEVASREHRKLSAGLEARKLRLVTEARVLYHEIGFLDAERVIRSEDLETLIHYQELARARYASGIGIQQPVIKLQAEITRDETALLGIDQRRTSALASLNGLKERPSDPALLQPAQPRPAEVRLDAERVRSLAGSNRPEVARADEARAGADARVQLARTGSRPDFTVGLTYSLVGRRTDEMARLSPPEDDGQDTLGFFAAINVPLWRQRTTSEIDESLSHRSAAEEVKRAEITRIHAEVEDLLGRLPLIWSRIRLLEDVLVLQAEESLRSAESAYAAGAVGALDLLDAERVLLEARTATERARADYAIATARLEGAVGVPLSTIVEEGDLP